MVTATANSVLTNSWHSGRNVDDYVYKVYAQPSVKTLKWDKNKEPKSILVIALSWHFTDFSCLFSDFITLPTDKPCGTQQSLEICVCNMHWFMLKTSWLMWLALTKLLPVPIYCPQLYSLRSNYKQQCQPVMLLISGGWSAASKHGRRSMMGTEQLDPL